MRTIIRIVSSLISLTVFASSSNPVRQAYLASLESQISALRDERAAMYKAKDQNTQRLLSMTQTLLEKEEQSRTDSDSLRKTRDEVASLRRKVEQHNELMAEKDRTAQVSLHITCVIVQFTHITSRSYTTRSRRCSLSWVRSRSEIRP